VTDEDDDTVGRDGRVDCFVSHAGPDRERANWLVVSVPVRSSGDDQHDVGSFARSVMYASATMVVAVGIVLVKNTLSGH